ncbi:hypothetical protein PG996_015607 [Apiospora saccharicola]|uniref:Rhodopsin domain-containing protein n=1 Tax=Apiospora saccharicola TaxID=335842 RepID=A0ABR1TLQ1_9PEZI
MADALSAMTPEQLAATPAGMPPPSVTPNFTNPASSAPVVIAVSSVLMLIMSIFAAVRCYVKVAIRHSVTSDDWTTLAAVIGTFWYFAICIHAVTKAKFGTHMWDMTVAHTLSDDFLIASFFTNWPTALVWALAKSSFFLMYLQIFGRLTWLRLSVYIGLFVNWGFYIGVIVASFYYQVPNPGQTWQEGFTNPRYTDSFNMTIPIASGSLVLDFYIFLLPLIAVRNLQLSPQKKLGVAAVFATGVIACIASSLSIYFKHNLNHHMDDYTFRTYPVLLMALIEMCVGISCSCMPSAAGFLKNKGGGGNRWGSSAISMLRSLLQQNRHKNISEQSDLPPRDPRKGPYVDVEMNDSTARALNYGGNQVSIA